MTRSPQAAVTPLADRMRPARLEDFFGQTHILGPGKPLRAAIEQARAAREAYGKATILFVDEVHRFNKAQQDGFLPYVEDGTFTFVGATTENPSFELNNALLSRTRVYVLKALTPEEIRRVIDRALTDKVAG